MCWTHCYAVQLQAKSPLNVVCQRGPTMHTMSVTIWGGGMCWQLSCPQDGVTLRCHWDTWAGSRARIAPVEWPCGQADSLTWVPWDLRNTGCRVVSHRCADMIWASAGTSKPAGETETPGALRVNPAASRLWAILNASGPNLQQTQFGGISPAAAWAPGRTSVCQWCCCGREQNSGQCHCLQVSFLPLWQWQGTKTQNQGVSNKVKFCFLSTWNVVTAQLKGRSLPGLVPDSECHEGRRTGVCNSPACSQCRGPTWCLPQHFSAHVQGLQTGSGFLVPKSRLHLNSSDNRDNLCVLALVVCFLIAGLGT